MNATDLISLICKDAELDPRMTTRVVRSFLEALAAELVDGHNVSIRGFGRFETHVCKETRRRNPATGEVVIVPEHRVLGFYASPGLKERLNGR